MHDPQNREKKEAEMKTVRFTDDSIRKLGRVTEISDVLWMAWSATGVEFYFTGKQLQASFVTDEEAKQEAKEPHIGVFVDGVCRKTFCVPYPGATVTILEEAVDGVVRILKLSEATESTIGMEALYADDAACFVSTEAKNRRMEFIGDSITCGYGVDGTIEETFSTHNENTSCAYAYLTAQAMNAEVNLISMSGHGVISGYTDSGVINSDQLVMPYYQTLGKAYGRFAGNVDPGTLFWDFSQYQPQVIVINLGTNDTSYCKDEPKKHQEYLQEYVKMLHTVRECNPKAKILCILGTMYQTVYGTLEKAVATYSEIYGDGDVRTLEMPLQQEADGVTVDWHPTKASHQKAAKHLIAYLKQHETYFFGSCET